MEIVATTNVLRYLRTAFCVLRPEKPMRIEHSFGSEKAFESARGLDLFSGDHDLWELFDSEVDQLNVGFTIGSPETCPFLSTASEMAFDSMAEAAGIDTDYAGLASDWRNPHSLSERGQNGGAAESPLPLPDQLGGELAQFVYMADDGILRVEDEQ
ncbi:hypothetical protein BH23VER1_BH23VER1_32680 [soil metagenome]